MKDTPLYNTIKWATNSSVKLLLQPYYNEDILQNCCVRLYWSKLHASYGGTSIVLSLAIL